MSNALRRPLVAPLPKTVDEFLAHRIVKSVVTFNNAVDEVFTSLILDEEFRSLLTNGVAVEGSAAAAVAAVAMKIREKARKTGNTLVAHAKLHDITLSIGVVTRRFDFWSEETNDAEQNAA